MGTLVSYGRGRGVVVETGMRTQMGLIATMLQNVEAEEITPLQRRLDQLGKTLSIASDSGRPSWRSTTQNISGLFSNRSWVGARQ
jgi:hypothetical protein